MVCNFSSQSGYNPNRFLPHFNIDFFFYLVVQGKKQHLFNVFVFQLLFVTCLDSRQNYFNIEGHRWIKKNICGQSEQINMFGMYVYCQICKLESVGALDVQIENSFLVLLYL